ncbi:MAG: TlpA disulfide reductase family protein [Salinivirgaceae bacterium]
MKKFPIVLSLILLVVMLGCKNSGNKGTQFKSDLGDSSDLKKTILSGKVNHSNNSEIILISDQLADTSMLDKTNQFSFTINLSVGRYFILRNGSKSIRIFLNPGDNLNVEYDLNDVINSTQFTGTGAATNGYLKEKSQRMLEQSIYLSHLYEVPEKQFRYLADSIYVMGKIYLEAYKESHPELSDLFIEQEQVALLYDWANQLMEYPRLNNQSIPIEKGTYFSFMNKLDVNNPTLLNIYEYKLFLNSYIAWNTDEQLKNSSNKNEDTYEVSLIRMQQTNKLITNEAVKNYLLASILKEQVKYFGYKNTELLFEVFEFNCTDTKLKKELLIPFQRYKALLVNDKAPSVTFVDVTGQTFTLDNFKGSYVYIDVWATWCLPCKRESPHFEELSRKFSNKNIQFVSLSVDEDGKDWKEYLTTFSYAHNQFWVTNPNDFLKNYLIKTIPRFIIIDPEGKIFDSEAFRPSEPDLKWFAGLPDKRAI